MILDAPARPRARVEADGPPERTTGQVFGIEVEGPGFVPLVPGSPGGSRGRRTVLELGTTESLKRTWRPKNPVSVLERRYTDGRLLMVVDYDADLGYLIHAPWNGRHMVSPDGRRVTSSGLPKVSRPRWEVVLFAQALPLAATLQGLELLHASAVVLEGRTIAFCAPSGTGKTSVAAHLVAGGASFLTDDVLPLERTRAGILAHPGAPTTKLAPAELATVPRERRGRLGTRVGRLDKVMLAPPMLERPQRLDGVYFLRRSPSAEPFRIDPCEPDPFTLFAHSYNTYVRTPDRIVNQLAVHASVVETVEMFTVVIPPSWPAREVAAAVRIHVGGSR